MVLVQGISIIVISFVLLGLGMYLHNFANKKLREGMNISGKKNDWTISSGGMLKQNEYLVAENKQYFFVWQSDGNAVVYRGSGPSDNKGAIWATGTNGRGGVTIDFQKDNNLVIYNSNNQPIWASGSGGKRNDLGYVFVNDRYCLKPLNNDGKRNWLQGDFTRHMVDSSNKKENCKKICDDLGDDCVTMALGDGRQNGRAYNCTTYKRCELSPEGSSTAWTRGSGNTGGQYEFFKKEKGEVMFMGGALGHKSKLIM